MDKENRQRNKMVGRPKSAIKKAYVANALTSCKHSYLDKSAILMERGERRSPDSSWKGGDRVRRGWGFTLTVPRPILSIHCATRVRPAAHIALNVGGAVRLQGPAPFSTQLTDGTINHAEHVMSDALEFGPQYHGFYTRMGAIFFLFLFLGLLGIRCNISVLRLMAK